MSLTMLAGQAITLAALALPLGQASAPQTGNTDVVQSSVDRSDRMTVPVQLGEHGTFRFLLDTGSQNTVIASSLARQLDIAPSGRVRVVGVAGEQMVDTIEIDEILLGRRSFYGLLAPLLERDHIGADGILGIDSLQDQRVLLDFEHNLIAVDDARQLGGNRGYEIVVTARRRLGQLIMTNATIDGVHTDVVIDTGAQASIGNLALQRALARRVQSQQARLDSVTGQFVMADVGLAKRLTLGTLNIDNVGIAFTDAPPFAELNLRKRPALLLGMRELRAFRRVAIDFTTRKVLFDLRKGT